jgi:carboxypeptidase Q
MKWVTSRMTVDGLENVRTEPVMVPRWERGRESAQIVEPALHTIEMLGLGGSVATPPAGIEAEVLPIDSFDDLRARQSEVRGRIVLFNAPFTNYSETVTYRTGGARTAALYGAVAVLVRSVGPMGLRTTHTGSVTYAANERAIPAAAISAEDANRIVRLRAGGRSVRVRLVMSGRTLPDVESANVIGEIRGRERPDEIVLIGAHLDAWDLGTGALDNGVNCALVTEVARAIAAGPKPRRTVRFVLFTSEETGLLGSLGYVRKHRSELDNHLAVLIHDIGDGKVLGYFTNGRPELDPAVRAALAPVAKWGADAANPEAILGTDNFDFLLEGVPNFVAIQETDRYLADYHASSDTFDKVDLEQARKNAAVAAVAVLGFANAPGRPGPRQSRAQVQELLVRTGLERQMKVYALWSEWDSGERGRAK